MTIHDVQVALRAIGISLSRRGGEFRVNFTNGPERTAYYTNDLGDALETGRAMSREGLKNPVYKKYGGREGSAEFRPMLLEEGKMLGYNDTVWVLANDGSARRVTVKGKVRRWKRDPDRIEVPYKYGMYEYGTLYSRDFGPEGRVLVAL